MPGRGYPPSGASSLPVLPYSMSNLVTVGQISQCFSDPARFLQLCYDGLAASKFQCNGFAFLTVHRNLASEFLGQQLDNISDSILGRFTDFVPRYMSAQCGYAGRTVRLISFSLASVGVSSGCGEMSGSGPAPSSSGPGSSSVNFLYSHCHASSSFQ